MGESMVALASLEESGAVTRIGLKGLQNISLERLEALGRFLWEAGDTVEWNQGDWLILVEDLFPEEASQIWDAMPLDVAVRMQRIRVGRAYAEHERHANLTWSHHRNVYSREPEVREHWLQRAENEGWSSARMRDELKEAEGPSNALPQPSKSYVMERACEAAEAAWKAAHLADEDGTFYLVPAEKFEAMAAALGYDPTETQFPVEPVPA